MNAGAFGHPRRTLAVLAALVLGGCSLSGIDMFGMFDEEPPVSGSPSAEVMRARADAARAAAEDGDTPSLALVPSRPAAGSSADRERAIESLIADREATRRTDEAVRLRGKTRPVAVVVDPAATGGGYVPVSARIGSEARGAAIRFGDGAANLDARGRRAVSAIAAARGGSDLNVLVVGRACGRTGEPSAPRREVAEFEASFARANAVAQALVEAGVPPDRVTVEALTGVRSADSGAAGEAADGCRAEVFFLR